MTKRPLRRKLCGWCDQNLERAARGHCGRMWSHLPDGTPLGDCWWVAAIREHGQAGALALAKGRGEARRLIAQAQAGKRGPFLDAVQAVLHQRDKGDPYRVGFLDAVLEATRPAL